MSSGSARAALKRASPRSAGIVGDGYMMMERNSDVIAAMIGQWIA